MSSELLSRIFLSLCEFYLAVSPADSSDVSISEGVHQDNSIVSKPHQSLAKSRKRKKNSEEEKRGNDTETCYQIMQREKLKCGGRSQ